MANAGSTLWGQLIRGIAPRRKPASEPAPETPAPAPPAPPSHVGHTVSKRTVRRGF